MDQSRALNALEPFLALAKSATSPRTAADLITQATSAPNTYVFAELLAQPNIQALAGDEQYGKFYELLKIFAWGTWDSYKAMTSPPPLSEVQTMKLRLLSLLTIAAQKSTSTTAESNLSYASLCARLDLTSPTDLEHLITQAIYADLLTGTLNPAAQIVAITSVAPLRDLAPGSVSSMIAELVAWSGRCDSVLSELEAEIAKVKAEAKKRNVREAKAKKQMEALMEEGEQKKGAAGAGGSAGISAGNVIGDGRSGVRSTRNTTRKGEQEGEEDEDPMDLDGGTGGSALGGGAGKKRSGGTGGGGGTFGSMMSRFGGRGGSR